MVCVLLLRFLLKKVLKEVFKSFFLLCVRLMVACVVGEGGQRHIHGTVRDALKTIITVDVAVSLAICCCWRLWKVLPFGACCVLV